MSDPVKPGHETIQVARSGAMAWRTPVLAAFAVLAGAALGTPASARAAGPDDLARRAVERRAIEAINWGMPAVNYDLMLQAMIKTAGGAANEIAYWSRLPDWKNQTLTPNPDVIYVMPFFDTKTAGAMVLEIPPAGDGSITGTIMDCWQSALEDVGPAGVDKGKGGRYLILRPGHKGPVPQGYIPLRPMTYQGYALLRSILKSGSAADQAKAVAYARRVKLYPLAKADRPPPTVFHDVVDVVFDSTIPYDLRFFESLDRIVQTEPWLPRDKAMLDMLRTLGIEKGKPFAPDGKTRETLEDAAREARGWLEAKYDAGFPAFYESTQWSFPASQELKETAATFYETPELYSVDARGLLDTYAFSTVKHMGAGQFYLMATRDKEGRPLDGGRGYRLTVPARVPVRQYWSAVVYDRATHAFIREVARPGRSSQSPGLRKNADGSVDLYFGPEAPEGKEANWVPTKRDSGFEVMFRFYGPEKTLFEKTWRLPDIEAAE